MIKEPSEQATSEHDSSSLGTDGPVQFQFGSQLGENQREGAESPHLSTGRAAACFSEIQTGTEPTEREPTVTSQFPSGVTSFDPFAFGDPDGTLSGRLQEPLSRRLPWPAPETSLEGLPNSADPCGDRQGPLPQLFAFEWENPDSGRKTQLTWTVLPQGFKNSPTIFGNQLAKELEVWERPPGNGTLLQYVDDILIATEKEEECKEWTVSLLNFLGLSGYRVSLQKVQILKKEVIYLGFVISKGQRKLGNDRKEAICRTPEPTTVKELRTFLGMTGWCRLWIYNYGLLVKPLYELLKNSQTQLTWTDEAKRAFKELKLELMRAPTLGLPDITKPFWLFSYERQGVALGILAQRLGPYKRAVSYFSKQLDEVSKRWPGCLRAVAAVVLIVQEARKFTLGQKMVVHTSHAVTSVLEQKGGHWLSPSRFLKYQAVLMEQDDIEIVTSAVINPASFLSNKQEMKSVVHDCIETIETVYASRPDLKDEPLEEADHTWYTDGSSFVKNGVRMAGYAVTTTDQVVEAKSLPKGTSAQ
ncbi:hypothetical protein QYF61_002843 [Mycteria americana]|uniref:ribonuclease H n=1 Tax=Mycteria americana TaxID=33587 RepID=A0AAN7N0H9_MYCAM|nr:hypothetical protein QYF61_002843 [Mycteria americana]